MNVIQAVGWSNDGRAVRIIDQRLLPRELVERDLRTVEEAREAIVTLAVRGAPAIGICGAMGVVVALQDADGATPQEFMERLRTAVARVGSARPTAVNLRWALDRAPSPSCVPQSSRAVQVPQRQRPHRLSWLT